MSKELTQIDIEVLKKIAYYNDEYQVNPLEEELSFSLGYNIDQIQRSLKVLTRAGYISQVVPTPTGLVS